jgi:hypothetical protein
MAAVKWKRRGVVALTVLGVAGAATAVASGATGQLTDVSSPTGAAAFAGDGGPVSSATFSSPQFLSRAPDGAVIIDDWADEVVRRVDPVTGAITTIAGKPGVASSSPTAANGDGGLATNATLNRPSGISFLADGTMLIADADNNRIRAVDPVTKRIRTVAGDGTEGDSGDGGAAVNAELDTPFDVQVLPNGKDFLIADSGNNRIRRVNTSSGKIYAFAGTGTSGEHDSANPFAATFSFPQSLSTVDGTTWFVADRFGPTVRAIGANGVTTVAGQAGQNGTPTSVGDGGPATQATLDLPLVVTALKDGGFLIADAQHFRIRRVAADGTISTIAGTGVAGYDGDGPLSTGRINEPVGLLPEADGSLLFVDWRGSNGAAMRLRRAGVDLNPVTPVTTGTSGSSTTTTPGSGTTGAGGGSALAPAAPPKAGHSVELDKSGSGKVLVTLPGSTQPIPLEQAASVPVGSVIDATAGKVKLTSARNRTNKAQTGTFWGGRFKVGQRRSTHYMTELRLQGGSFASCPSSAPAPTGASSRLAVAAKAKSKRKRSVRKLWGKDHGGRFQTHGRDSVATVRGTHWLTQDRCDGTVTTVASGVVAVKDRVGGKVVVLHKGQSHLARHRKG